MPLFDYVGQLKSGSSFQGTLEADSHENAEKTLAKMGIRVTSMRNARRFAHVVPLSLDDYVFFNEQVAAMAKSGIPLETGLRNLAADAGSRKLKRILISVANDISAGVSLEQAVERHKRSFPEQLPGVVRAGLLSGDLSGALYALTAHLRVKGQVRRALIEAAAYPLTVLAFALAIVSFVMRGIVPLLESTYRDWLGTRTGNALSEALFSLSHSWPSVEIVIGALLAVVALMFAAASLSGAERWREILFSAIPGMSQIHRSSVLARFAHTSAIAARGGASLPEIVKLAGAASGSPSLSGAARRAAGKLEQGASLSDAVANEPRIPALWSCIISVSGPRGELPSALAELARAYESRTQSWIAVVRTLLSPVLLIIVGGILAFIMVALMGAFGSFGLVSGINSLTF